jgi:hypothetical protein
MRYGSKDIQQTMEENEKWNSMFIPIKDATPIALIQRAVGTSRFPRFYRELYPALSQLGKELADKLIEVECKRKSKKRYAR